MSKTARVYTNDPANSQIALKISGPVEKLADISPGMVSLNGPAGKPLTKTVEIRPTPKYPFRIKSAEARRGRYIRFSLQEKRLDGRSGYLLTVENTRSEPGRYFDYIYLTTDQPQHPRLKVKVRGHIRKPPENNVPAAR